MLWTETILPRVEGETRASAGRFPVGGGVAARAPICLALWLASSATAQERPPRTVVSVHPGTAVFTDNRERDAAIRTAFLARADLRVDYFAEYLEVDRFSWKQASLALRDSIRRKYQGRPIDLVIANTTPVFRFVLQERSELFPDAAIVFFGVGRPDPSVRSAGAGVTGLETDAGYRDTVALALKLHPETERIFVLAEGLQGSFREMVEPALRDLPHPVELTYIDQLSIDDLLQSIRVVPASSLVLYVQYMQTEPGRLLYQQEVARLVAEVSPVPVYGVTESQVGSGIVGGLVRSPEILGSRLGEIAVEILDGKRAQDIPIAGVPLVPMFDWRQIERWNISPALLPEGSVFRFREPSAWERYRRYILIAIAVFALQSLTIAALLFQRSRRRETEARNAAILKAIPDRMFLLNRDGVFLDAHAPGSAVESAPVPGSHLRDIFPADAAAAIEEGIARSKSGESPDVSEYSVDRPDGTHHFEARVVPAGGGHILAIVRDITARRRAETALHHAEGELRRVSRLALLGEFTASIAHEVRQPLTAILMNARSCLKRLSGEGPDITEVEAGLADIVDASRRAEEVIQRNRELFRNQRVEKAALDINDVVREAVELASTRLRDQHVQFAMALARDLPPVSGDRVELQQVLLNLIANGIEAMEAVDPASRRAQVSTLLEDGGMVRVSVSDSGVGLEGVDRQRLFTLAYTTKPTGTGVGLSISRSIVAAHGGRLWAEPNEGGGAVFHFTVPVYGTAAGDEEAELSARV
jgi:PAS domain S-box-containing protein